VRKAGGMRPASRLGIMAAVAPPTQSPVSSKPPLSVTELLGGGFELSSRWILLDSGELTIDRPLPRAIGVYAFAKDVTIVCVGVATKGRDNRMYSYGKPGVAQLTNQRLYGKLKNELLTVPFGAIFTAMPADLEWNGPPVHASAGLELGLINKFALPWNIQSAN